jgi:hypothetical protein
VVRRLQAHEGIDGKKLAVWGDSFAKVNASDAKLAVPLDVDGPAISEPGGANLALLSGLFEDGVVAVYARGGLNETIANGPYLYVPHEAVIRGPLSISYLAAVMNTFTIAKYEGTVDFQNRANGEKPMEPTKAAEWLIGQLKSK